MSPLATQLTRCGYEPLAHPLQYMQDQCLEMLGQFGRATVRVKDPQLGLLRSVNDVMGTTAALLVEINEDDSFSEHAKVGKAADLALLRAAEEAVHDDILLATVDAPFRTGRGIFGRRFRFETADPDSPEQPVKFEVDAIPCLVTEAPNADTAKVIARFVVLLLRRPGALAPVGANLDEPLARLIGACFALVVTGTARDQEHFVEMGIDSLRLAYGTVPLDLYKVRQELFTQRLKRVTFVFQPIVQIKRPIAIVGWEALARYADEQRSPGWLFRTAELWGTHFIAEIDIHALTHATDAFAQAVKAQMSGTNCELTINVTPASLRLENYRRQVVQVARNDADYPFRLTLEISEKYEFAGLAGITPVDHDASPDGPPQHSLTDELRDIRGDVSIAIDDFGVLYSSIWRAIELKPRWIKIDKAFLTGPHLEPVTNFAHHIGADYNGQVIVEGIENETQLRLAKKAKANCIQGYLTGYPKAEVYELSDEVRARIKQAIVDD